MKGEDYRTEKVEKYVEELFAPEDAVFKRIRERTVELGIPQINVGPTEGKILYTLLRAIGAKRVVEVGTLAGYSAVWMARALPPDGKLYTCEYEPKHADAAREAFRDARLDEKIQVLVGDATDTLRSLEDKGPFDAVFIDADKNNYGKYADWAERNLRKGGLIIGDNSYIWGLITCTEKPEGNEGAQWMGMRRFNEKLADSSKYAGIILPTKEGLTVAVKL